MQERRGQAENDAVESVRAMRGKGVGRKQVCATLLISQPIKSKVMEVDDWLTSKSVNNYPLKEAFTLMAHGSQTALCS